MASYTCYSVVRLEGQSEFTKSLSLSITDVSAEIRTDILLGTGVESYR
jgi:hypothetical protein